MLAKEIKIRNIKQQRDFIMNQLKEYLMEHPRNDGNTAYRYVGHVLPEIVDYFKGEGFDVKCLISDMILSATQGMPIYLFTISDNVVLSDEELKAAEEFEYKFDDDERSDAFDDFMSALLGGND